MARVRWPTTAVLVARPAPQTRFIGPATGGAGLAQTHSYDVKQVAVDHDTIFVGTVASGGLNLGEVKAYDISTASLIWNVKVQASPPVSRVSCLATDGASVSTWRGPTPVELTGPPVCHVVTVRACGGGSTRQRPSGHLCVSSQFPEVGCECLISLKGPISWPSYRPAGHPSGWPTHTRRPRWRPPRGVRPPRRRPVCLVRHRIRDGGQDLGGPVPSEDSPPPRPWSRSPMTRRPTPLPSAGTP